MSVNTSLIAEERSTQFVKQASGGTRPFIVGIGGTTREGSSSQRCLANCLGFAELYGARTEMLAGPDLPEVIYKPGSSHRSEAALRLIEAMREADGIIIASPAYHGGISGHLKNALDYLEDMKGDDTPYLEGRSVGLICCAMGWQAGGSTLGSLRAVVHALRGWPTPLGVLVNTAVENADSLAPSTEMQLRTMAEQVVQHAFPRAALRQSKRFSEPRELPQLATSPRHATLG